MFTWFRYMGIDLLLLPVSHRFHAVSQVIESKWMLVLKIVEVILYIVVSRHGV